jgi:toxin ParE1/3/4
MAELIWTEPALAQLEAIAEVIALDKPDAAAAVVQKVVEVTDRVVQFAKLGKKIPEFQHTNYRQMWIKPCWIYYRIEGPRIYILHVRRGEKQFRSEDIFPEDD